MKSMTVGMIEHRRDELSNWLISTDCEEDQKHLDQDTPERDYWHHGYFTALNDILNLLNKDGDA